MELFLPHRLRPGYLEGARASQMLLRRPRFGIEFLRCQQNQFEIGLLKKSSTTLLARHAQYHLGYCYYYGLGVTQDYRKAVYWFEKAIEKNHAASEYYLGLCYLNGNGVPPNPDKAKVSFRKAVKQGYEEARKYL